MSKEKPKVAEQPAIDWLASRLNDNVAYHTWVNRTEEEKKQWELQHGMPDNYGMKVVNHYFPDGKTLELDEGKYWIKCDSEYTRSMVQGLGRKIKELESELNEARREREFRKRHPLDRPLSDLKVEKEFPVSLSDEQAQTLNSLQRKTKAGTASETVGYLLDMIADRLDPGYWKYLAITALIENYHSFVDWYNNHPEHADKWDSPAKAKEFADRLYQLRAGAKMGKSFKDQFLEWADIWDDETGHWSVGLERHWTYFAIMSIGEQAVPWILERYKEHMHPKWHMILTQLTGVNPTDPEHRKLVAGGLMQALDVPALQEDWLTWGRKQKLIQ